MILTSPSNSLFSQNLIKEALNNTDKRVKNDQSVTPGFLIAAMLWPELLKKSKGDKEINLRKFLSLIHI